MERSLGTEHATGAQRPEVFSRVVVGVDGTEPGFEACRQARRLVEPDGWIELVAAPPRGIAYAPRGTSSAIVKTSNVRPRTANAMCRV